MLLQVTPYTMTVLAPVDASVKQNQMKTRHRVILRSLLACYVKWHHW